jgi:cation:H+ antiporter
VSPLIILGYVAGLRFVADAHRHPWWQAEKSEETQEDVPDDDTDEDADDRESTASLWVKLLLLAAVTGVAGWALARAGSTIAAETALSATLVGALFTSTATSLPELVTTIAAVRRGP